jgi:serine/threonine protein kinase
MLGPYRVLNVLGRGGMGIVFRAYDPRLHRMIALKTLYPAHAEDPVVRGRLFREALTLAAIMSDYVVPIYHIGEDGLIPYIAMPCLEGRTLAMEMRSPAGLGVAEMLRIGQECATGLAAAHRLGLIHRDIKPSNLWLEAEFGRVKILDFGLAKPVGIELDAVEPLTLAGTVLGTPGYMSAEQAQGQYVDARSDLFSLGVVLYQLSVGEWPFRGDTLQEILAAQAIAPPPPHAKNPEIPVPFSALVLQLLSKCPARRPRSADVVACELQRIRTGLVGEQQTRISPIAR